jgi:hypothetical protein
MRLTAVDQRLLLMAGLSLSCLSSFAAFRAVPTFSDVFQSFTGGLPLVTELALRFYPSLLALPAIVLLVWVLWPKREHRGVAALAAAIVLSVALPLVLALVMYLPIAAL